MGHNYSISGTALGAFSTVPHWVDTAIFQGQNCPHFTDEAFEAQREYTACPKPTQQVRERADVETMSGVRLLPQPSWILLRGEQLTNSPPS